MSDGDAADLTDLAAADGKKPGRLRATVLGVVVLVAAGAGIYTWKQVKPVVDAKSKYGSVTYAVPKAPKLTAKAGETVYRIDPTRSSLTYEVQEQFAGKSTSKATGTTNGIGGDIALNAKHLEKSRVGAVKVDVEQFHSDNNLRDARLRQDFLESHDFPIATFKIMEISGLDGALTEGKTYPFTLTGAVTIKAETVKASFDATAKLVDGTLHATATTKAKLSRFDAGPIRIAGLVSTSDDVTLRLKLTALDPAEHTIPTTITGPHAKEAADAPSFAKTVQPILEANCVSCHATGEMGSAHVTIDDAGDARAISDGIGTVTKVRYMPPWPASDKGLPLAHKMTLTSKQIDQIAAWSAAGGKLDVPASTKLHAVKPKAGIVPRRDKVLTRPAYTGSLENTNDYRCFVLDPKLTKATYLTGYEFIADQVQELHHAQVFHITAAQRANAVDKEGEGGRPGWSCYGGPGLSSFRLPPELRGKPRDEVRAYFRAHPELRPKRTGGDSDSFTGQPGLVAGWVPGQAPVVFPEGSGIVMEPGDALVLQLHYHFAAKPTPDTSSMALQLDPITPKRKVLRIINPIGPVEIPCAPKDRKAPLCDRDAALAEDARLYGPSGADNEKGLLFICDKTADELAATFDGNVASSSCDTTVPEDGIIVGALGHMHTLGKTFRLTLDPGTKKQKILLDIPDWSFDWQMNYELETPLRVKKGEKLRMDCSWDRRADPLRAPKYIVFAEGTEDEMCFGTYALIPDEQ